METKLTTFRIGHVLYPGIDSQGEHVDTMNQDKRTVVFIGVCVLKFDRVFFSCFQSVLFKQLHPIFSCFNTHVFKQILDG
mmetsp:Transcript_31891/g.42121  ORF Transcript_31891/g.42121 Transcript_31891/m.42121 type:complete len:80 (-) Transcript_31891:10-249(-)